MAVKDPVPAMRTVAPFKLESFGCAFSGLTDSMAIAVLVCTPMASILFRSVTMSAHARGVLPGKLLQATGYKPEDKELFFVEGDSASTPAKEARLPWQEVLSLRGKILNAAREDFARVFANREVQDIMTAIGTKPGEDCKTSGGSVRIGKITILTDADTDGKHICSLLIALFCKYFRPWVAEGRVQFVNLPLFVGVSGETKHYGFTREELMGKFPEGKQKSVTVSRLKGLGEMQSSELFDVGLNPETRKIYVLSLDDADELEVARVMGKDVAYRKEFLGISR